MVPSPDRSRRRWISASDLGEYTYCPRAWWYRAHPPSQGPSASSQRAARAGERFHARSLDGERARERWAVVYALLLAVAVLLLVVGILGALS